MLTLEKKLLLPGGVWHCTTEQSMIPDDTGLVGKISNEQDANWKLCNLACKALLVFQCFQNWEMCIDFRKNIRCPKPAYHKRESEERVETDKYLGVVFDSKLNWKENVTMCWKIKWTSECIAWENRSFGSQTRCVLVTFYGAVIICSFIMFGSVCWVGHFFNLIEES